MESLETCGTVTPLGSRGNGEAAFPAAEAIVPSPGGPAVVVPHLGSVRLLAVSREADPADSSSRQPAGPVVGGAPSAR
jgi:hypothetical protein